MKICPNSNNAAQKDNEIPYVRIVEICAFYRPDSGRF